MVCCPETDIALMGPPPGMKNVEQPPPAVLLGSRRGRRRHTPQEFFTVKFHLVPKLLLGNAIARQALLGLLKNKPMAESPVFFPKQSFSSMGVPKQELGNQKTSPPRSPWARLPPAMAGSTGFQPVPRARCPCYRKRGIGRGVCWLAAEPHSPGPPPGAISLGGADEF